MERQRRTAGPCPIAVRKKRLMKEGREMNKKILVLLGAAIFLLGACSDDDETTNATVTGSSGAAVVVDDNWGEGCMASGDGSENIVIGLTSTSFVFTADVYSSSDCSSGLVLSVAGLGTAVLGASINATLDGSSVAANKFDTSFTSFTWTIADETTVTAGNAVGFCGITDWELNVAREVIDDPDCGIPADERDEKDLIYIDDNVTPNLLHFGLSETQSGTLDADGYPEALDPNGLSRL